MKNALLAFLFAFSAVAAYAQQSFGYGATWYYSYSEFGFTGYKKIQHDRDTTFMGMTWHVFEVTGTRTIASGPNQGSTDTAVVFDDMFLATRNDSVFRVGDSGPELLYDFNAQLSDTWQFAQVDGTFGCTDVPVATVIAKGNETIDGQSVPYWDLQFPMDTIIINPNGSTAYDVSSSFAITTRMYRRIGSTYYNVLFAPTVNTCDGTNFQLSQYQLRCYMDAQWDVHITSLACNNYPGMSAEEFEARTLDIYPNPAHDRIRLRSSGDLPTAGEMMDAFGRTVATLNVIGDEVQLPRVAPGMYWIVWEGGFPASKVEVL